MLKSHLRIHTKSQTEAVMTLQTAGIINGKTDTTFEPHSNATRAQSAKVIFDTFVDAQ